MHLFSYWVTNLLIILLAHLQIYLLTSCLRSFIPSFLPSFLLIGHIVLEVKIIVLSYLDLDWPWIFGTVSYLKKVNAKCIQWCCADPATQLQEDAVLFSPCHHMLSQVDLPNVYAMVLGNFLTKIVNWLNRKEVDMNTCYKWIDYQMEKSVPLTVPATSFKIGFKTELAAHRCR